MSLSDLLIAVLSGDLLHVLNRLDGLFCKSVDLHRSSTPVCTLVLCDESQLLHASGVTAAGGAMCYM